MTFFPPDALCKICQTEVETHNHGELKKCLKAYKMELEQILYHLNHISNPLYQQSPNEAQYILAELKKQ